MRGIEGNDMEAKLQQDDSVSAQVAELLHDGAHLCEYEEPSDEVVSGYRARCRALLKRIGAVDAKA